MAEVDASVYGKFTHNNPLEMFSNLTNLSTALQQNKLLEMQVKSKQQLGKAVQEATDPETGRVDTQLLQEIMKRPENYPAAVEGAGLGLDLTGKELSNIGQATTNLGLEQNLSQSGFENLGTAWGARLASTQGPLVPDDLRNDVLDLLAAGRITPKVAKAALQGMPTNPDELRFYAAGGFLQSLGPAGIATPGAAPPGPRGEPRQQAAGQTIIQELGAGLPTPEDLTPPPPAPGITTGLSPATAAALPEIGTSAAKQSIRLSALANEVPTRKALLDNMLADAAEFTSGPMSEDLKTALAGINELFGTRIQLDRVAAQERFDKIANQIALQQSGELGVSDLTTQTAMGANPNSRLSNLGIVGVIAQLKGNEDAILVKNEKWQDYLDDGGSEEDFYSWSRNFNKRFDPRVFQASYLDEVSKRKMIATLNPAELKKFKEHFNYAVEQGWIPDPRSQ